MDSTLAMPKTLQEAIAYFSDPDNAFRYAVALRWPDGHIACPRCGSVNHSFVSTRRVWFCNGCHRQFSIKVGTIFEDSPLGMDKWMTAVWLISNCKNGISSYELSRDLGVTQKSAWFMLQRIRLAMQTGAFRKMGGEVEVDETFIGGRARYMHKTRRDKMIKGRGPMGKAVVMGLLERHGADGHSTVIVKHVPTTRRRALDPAVREHVEPGTEVFTDALPSYDALNTEYAHQVIDHAERYAEGKVHTNGLENFWSLFKRGVKGTYVSIEPFHLFRYLDEQSFRFNNRKTKDAERFTHVMRQVTGRRVTYKQLIGKEQEDALRLQ